MLEIPPGYCEDFSSEVHAIKPFAFLEIWFRSLVGLGIVRWQGLVRPAMAAVIVSKGVNAQRAAERLQSVWSGPE